MDYVLSKGRLATYFESNDHHRCFVANFWRIRRKTFVQNNFEQLLLHVFSHINSTGNYQATLIKQISCSMFLITLVSLISVSLVASERVFSLFVKSKKISDLSTKSLFKKDCFYFFQNFITFKKLSMNTIHYYWRLIWYFLHKYVNFFQQRANH